MEEAARMADEVVKSESVTLDVPGRIIRDMRTLVEAGIYLSVDEALRESILANWRFIRGSYHSIRIDGPTDDADEKAEAPAGDAPKDEPANGEPTAG
jgi:Arc/MetJ-type ribon-helix-helix transcriptional regulator